MEGQEDISGVFRAEFVEAHEYFDARSTKQAGNRHKLAWRFRITSGPHAGKLVTRKTNSKPGSESYDQMVTMLQASIDPAPEYDGQMCRVRVKEGRVDQVTKDRPVSVRLR